LEVTPFPKGEMKKNSTGSSRATSLSFLKLRFMAQAIAQTDPGAMSSQNRNPKSRSAEQHVENLVGKCRPGRKRTGDAEIGWRPTPEKNIETMPCWGKNSPENCLVDLGRDTRTSTQSRRLVRRKGASWSLNWPSGANLLAHLQLKCILYVPL